MKKLVLIASLCVLAAPVSADVLLGKWLTAPDENGFTAIIDVAPCGSKICGTNIQSMNASGKKVTTDSTGTKLMWDMVNKGGGSYAGRVYSPAKDKEYKGKLSLSGDTLNVKGCIGPICLSAGRWARM